MMANHSSTILLPMVLQIIPSEAFLRDKNGNLWFGNGSGKISFLDSKKKLPGEKPNFMNYTIAEGLTDVQTITEDKNGNLWFGTGEGAFRVKLG